MSTTIPLEIGTQSNPGRYGQDGAARLINCCVEELGKEGKAPYPVYAASGLDLFATLPDGGAVRAMIETDTHLYVVSGKAIFRVDASGFVEQIGGMPSDGHVTMSRNRAGQITVTCDGVSKVITGASVVDLEDSDLPPANSNFNLGGYTVWTIPDGRVFWSAIDNSNEIDALDFKSAEANPDGLRIGKALGQHAVLFGTKSTEFHILSGADDVFSRSHVINVGCYAAGSVSEVPIITAQAVTDSIAFAAADRQGAYAGVCIVQNLSSHKISTHAVDRAVRDEPDPRSITSCTWSDGGHAFYCISGDTFSWCWDSATGQWHELMSYGFNRWRVRTVHQFAGGLIAGDHYTNKLYRMGKDYLSEAGDPLIMTVQTPPVVDFPHAIEFLSAYFDIVPQGPGILEESEETLIEMLSWDDDDPLAWDDETLMAWDAVESSSANADPEGMISWSDDGIHWTPPRFVKLGRMGETMKRVMTHRLGQTKRGAGRSFRFSVSADVAKGLMGAAVTINRIAA